MTGFPDVRLRRLRINEKMRSLVRENEINTGDLIYPLFIVEGNNIKEEILTMPGIFRFSPDKLPSEVEEIKSLQIPAIILFGIPAYKDESGSGAWSDKGVIQQAIKIIKQAVPELIVITDVCLCEYTDHGHCGIITNEAVDNDKTLPLLTRMALSHARAGADIVAPSDMMDGRVGAIRRGLDAEGFINTSILAYSAKYASAFYGPFREAAESAPRSGDRRSYQMDPSNLREALREIELDIQEGADILMIKPALAYLDVIRKARDKFQVPLAAYNVSGEYAMVKAAAQNGWLEEKRSVLEILTSIKRAGADMILTYHAKEVARWLHSC